MRRPTIPYLVLLGAVAAIPTLHADSIRGNVKSVVRLTVDPTFEQTTELTQQEYVLIVLPQDVTFLDGVQIELTLSGEARSHYDNFGFVVYDRLDQVPAPGVRSLTATRVFLHGLLPLNRAFYFTGTTERRGLQNDLSQGIFRLPDPRSPTDYPILAGVIAIMKGVPESAQGLVFYLKAKPIVRNAGRLVLRVRPPAGDHRYTVSLDGGVLEGGGPTAQTTWEVTQELTAGLHTVRVTSPTLQTAESTFAIEPAGTRVVEIDLSESSGSVAIEAPRGAVVYVDGRKLDLPREGSLTLPPGEHTIRYTVGDYTSARTFTVAEGKRYTVYLEMTIGVKED